MTNTIPTSAPPTGERDLVRVPIDEVYVAIMPCPPGHVNDRVAAYTAEGQLPRPIDELAIAWKAVAGQLVVLAVDREKADGWLVQGATSAMPEALPAVVHSEAPGTNVNSFEFLRGPNQPIRVGTQRRIRRRVLLFMAIAASVALAYGAHRRSEVLLAQGADVEAATGALAHEALPRMPDGAPPELALTGELRRLAALAKADGSDAPPDGRFILAALLEHWPQGFDPQVERLEATGDRILLHAGFASRGQAMAFADALTGVPGFAAELPQVRSAAQRGGEAATLEVALRHNEESGR